MDDDVALYTHAQPARMLTDEEVSSVAVDGYVRWSIKNAQRKFCEVNGITLKETP